MSGHSTPYWPLVGGSATAVGPVRSRINITSLTATVPSDGINLTLTALYVPLAATDCSSTLSAKQLFQASDLHAGTPLTPSFGTPLQVPPKANRAVCLEVISPGATASLSGYLS